MTTGTATADTPPAESDWHPDFLGGFSARRLPLHDVPEVVGESVDDPYATVVRLDRDAPSQERAEMSGDQADRHPREAVLYLHGWNDYFFQAHVAQWWADREVDFYALDLRRCGRSLIDGQLPGYVNDLTEYYEEVDRAYELVAQHHDRVWLMGHSTGGLVASLWAHDRPGRAAALVLNSPWLEFQGSAAGRALGATLLSGIGRRRPTTVLPMHDTGFYARTIHSRYDGPWDYDLTLKPNPSQPIRVGWLRAALRGHQRVAQGLDIQAPVLVMCSTRSDLRLRWSPQMAYADIVLDVEQIAMRAHHLGRRVLISRIEGGMHDLTLSKEPARSETFATMAAFVAGVRERLNHDDQLATAGVAPVAGSETMAQ
ncbi:alpha/beta hydrolase [Parenemella sanctibonifatiensis]|uniref:Alpha/beta hydrolase n=1 Tax=Parenemella sanctibonifatiensis TaxID=2016505 RepID=A0A255EBK7_9ACTN|nr:alpha/beta hydrolase [Parenemella sanctibonifatiensis]